MDVIKGVDGVVCAGELLCILGPSGAGKTTLLDVLAGRHKAGRVTGSIAFSGGSRSSFVQSRTGYVMQDDALHPLLTVRETLMFSSRLRVPVDPNISIEENHRLRQAKIDDIIRVLRLQRVADARIGNAEKRGLSGGERRRVSIGEQLGTKNLIFN
jgi:ABC-type multidrug transport system ATPase subunit